MDLQDPEPMETQEMPDAQRIIYMERKRIESILDDQDSDEKGPPWLWKKKKQSDAPSDYVMIVPI